MKKEETLLKSDVRAALVSGIELWLKRSKEKDEEREQFSFGTWQREALRNQSWEYYGMAQANFFVGERLGLLTYDDYPTFRPNDEKPVDDEEEEEKS